MPFFGILWVASWLNCSLSYGFQGSLISDYLSAAFKNKPLANISNPLVKLTNQSSVLAKETVASTTPTTGEDSFCQTETTSLEYSWANLPTISREKDLVLNSPSQEVSQVSFPSQIMQVFHSLFNWQDYFVSKPKANPVAVVVTRSNTLLPPQARRNFWLLSQKLPENISSDVQQSPGQPLVSATSKFQVWLQRHLIAEFDQKLDADLLAQRLQQLVLHPNLDAQKLQPGLVNGEPAIKLGDRLLFLVDDALKDSMHLNKELIAVKLVNSLRVALGVNALDLAQAQAGMYKLSETSDKISGLASWYGSYFHGRQTANGEIYNQYALTVAHPSLPFNTYLKITNQKNNKSVIVRVNDRGPYIPPRVLDLSNIAAQCINSEDTGVVMVDAVIMQPVGESKLEKK